MSVLHPKNMIITRQDKSNARKDLAFAEKIIREAVPEDGATDGSESMSVDHIADMICGRFDYVITRKLNTHTSLKEKYKQEIVSENSKLTPNAALVDSLRASLTTTRRQLSTSYPPRIEKDRAGEIIGLAKIKRLATTNGNIGKAQSCEALRRPVVIQLIMKIIAERQETWVYPNEEI